MFLSCFGKKGTKEAAIGEALKAALPRTQATLPYVPLLARTWHLPSTLTIETCLLRMVLLLAACETTAALRLVVEKKDVIARNEVTWQPSPQIEKYLCFRNMFHSSEFGWAGIGTFPPFVYRRCAYLR